MQTITQIIGVLAALSIMIVIAILIVWIMDYRQHKRREYVRMLNNSRYDPFMLARHVTCECGVKCDPFSPDWRWSGSHWQHHHGYPVGHVDCFPKKDQAFRPLRIWKEESK